MDHSPPFFNSQFNQAYNSQPPSQFDSQSPSQPSQYSFPQQYSINPQYPHSIFNPQFFPGQPSFHQPFQPTNLQPATTQNNSDQLQQTERNPNFTKDEDEALCKAWLRVSENPATGTDQTKKKLWDTILDEFKCVLGTETDRLGPGLSNRWSAIQREINKYSAAVRKVQNAPQSGFGVENTIEAYHKEFFRAQKHHFKLDGCWLILKDSAKWFNYTKEQSEKQKKIRQRKRAISNVDVDGNEDSSNLSTPATTPSLVTGSVSLDDDDSPFSQGPHELQRPPRRKQAKTKKFNNNSGMNLFVEQFDNLRKDQMAIVEKEFIMARERDERKIQIKLEQERLRRETRLEQERMKIAAKDKQDKIRMEKEIMMTDPSSITTAEGKAWIIAQQKAIWANLLGGVEDGSSGNGD